MGDELVGQRLKAGVAERRVAAADEVEVAAQDAVGVDLGAGRRLQGGLQRARGAEAQQRGRGREELLVGRGRQREVVAVAEQDVPGGEVDDVGAGGRAEAVVERRQRRAQACTVDRAGGGDQRGQREQRDEREQGETAAHGTRR